MKHESEPQWSVKQVLVISAELGDGENDTALSPSQLALERLFLRINGHVVAIDNDVETSHIQTAKKVQGLLDSMRPPIVVCVGISAYNLVQELSLPWQPVVIAARHTISWGADYERTLAEQINGLLSTKAT